MKLLLETGKVDVDSKDSDSRTPLSWAAEFGQEAVVKLLLETGKVDVDSKDSDSRTPLSWAAQNRHEAVVKLLLETGKVDVDSKEQERSDAAVVGCGVRARGGREAAARDRQGGRGLEGQEQSDAAVVGCGERARGGREAPAIFYSYVACYLQTSIPPTAVPLRLPYISLNNHLEHSFGKN